MESIGWCGLCQSASCALASHRCDKGGECKDILSESSSGLTLGCQFFHLSAEITNCFKNKVEIDEKISADQKRLGLIDICCSQCGEHHIGKKCISAYQKKLFKDMLLRI
ncbi:MAG: hypothetical protein Hyperionvirus7_26 [Hyperionvirus sp.]|uniref:Uncharacterized protein n=1 Tax=Hyperionvirus sp. TaxID=2487770 RepID=A0A3G5A879_9VIRU|nr:MAG: hypothetical protein Hyperionvirus7_26 [Hyperionvirus sp.]